MRAAVGVVGGALHEPALHQALGCTTDRHFVHDGPCAYGLLCERSVFRQHGDEPPLWNGESETILVSAGDEA